VQQLQQLASQSVHAYLFVGPEGCGKEEAARAFSTVLITGSADATTREAKLIARSAYSDVVEVLREGAAVDKDEADNIVEIRLKTKPEVLHAESNAIAKLAKSTNSGLGATMFITHAPCLDCAKLVYQSGINTVYYRNSYRNENGIQFLEKAGVKIEKI